VREFGELESAIMDVVWAGDRAYLVREVRERMTYNRDVAYTTVMTVMNILHGKGVLRREKHGRAWRYWPAESREEHDARLMAEVFRSGGDQRVTMVRFLERVSDEEVASLRTALDDVHTQQLGCLAGDRAGHGALAGGLAGDVYPGMDTEFGQDVRDMGGHGPVGQEQPGGDLRIGQPFGDQPDHLDLGRGQAVPAALGLPVLHPGTTADTLGPELGLQPADIPRGT
jgi:predicted transcriptional regulator